MAAEPDWVEACTLAELRKRGKLVVQHGDLRLVVLLDDDRPTALDDECIHKQRELHKGMVLNGRLVCPGHQWAFDLSTGYCRERDRHQPMYASRLEGETVLVDVSAPLPVPDVDDVQP